MSIALVVTRGYSNGTLTGSIADVVTRGYTIGAAATGAAAGSRQTAALRRDHGLPSAYHRRPRRPRARRR